MVKKFTTECSTVIVSIFTYLNVFIDHFGTFSTDTTFYTTPFILLYFPRY